VQASAKHFKILPWGGVGYQGTTLTLDLLLK